jgi:hypothetical protein
MRDATLQTQGKRFVCYICHAHAVSVQQLPHRLYRRMRVVLEDRLPPTRGRISRSRYGRSAADMGSAICGLALWRVSSVAKCGRSR